jgi:hypothetical protein
MQRNNDPDPDIIIHYGENNKKGKLLKAGYQMSEEEVSV